MQKKKISWQVTFKKESSTSFYLWGFFGEYFHGTEHWPPHWIIHGHGHEWKGIGKTPNPLSIVCDWEMLEKKKFNFNQKKQD